MPIRFVLFGAVAIVAMMWALLTFRPIPGAETGLGANLLAAIFVVVFGFLFVTVSSRICGLIGSSSNPISGMAIATLMATCAMFLVVGWTRGSYAVLALTIGGVVCIAAANGGGTSQDFKTGYLVGATPSKQQIALIIGAMASVFAVGGTLKLMNMGLAEYKPVQIAVDVAHLPDGAQVEAAELRVSGQDLRADQCAGIEHGARRQISLRSATPSRSRSSGCKASAATKPRRRRRG